MNQVKVYNFDVWECDNVQMDLETVHDMQHFWTLSLLI